MALWVDLGGILVPTVADNFGTSLIYSTFLPKKNWILLECPTINVYGQQKT